MCSVEAKKNYNITAETLRLAYPCEEIQEAINLSGILLIAWKRHMLLFETHNKLRLISGDIEKRTQEM